MPDHSAARSRSAACSRDSAGSRRRSTASAAAMCIMVGKLSLEDWPRLTWSFGCTGFRLPSGCPSIWLARLAITSLAFMLVWVPLPVCQTGNGNSSSRSPAAISSAALAMVPARSAGSSPRRAFAAAQADLCRPTARIRPGGNRSVPMRNRRRARSVCGPQSRSAGMSMAPRESVSVRRASAMLGECAGAVAVPCSPEAVQLE
jgi:hypothetical protein